MSRQQPGAALGASYRLLERIGSGAAGDVWVAEPIAGGGVLAAKILKSAHAQDPALVERFVRERSVMLGLRHRNIVEVRDLVVEGETLAIVMEFLPGGSVRDLLTATGPLPPSDALHICAQVFQALARAHTENVTHRDIKPDNVLLTEPWDPGQRDTVRVSDFGIASVVNERNRQTTGLLGTPQYMAPELISHGRTLPAADVYSTGVMLYELLAGRTPFAGSGTDFTIAYRHVTSRPPPLELPAPLWAAVDRLLSKDPRERPTAIDAAASLTHLAAQFADLLPLDAQPSTDSFSEVERPATMLRADLLPSAEETPEYPSPLSAESPSLGTPGQKTILRALPLAADLPPNQHPGTDPGATTSTGRPIWHSRPRLRTIALCTVGVALLGGLGIGITIAFGGEKVAAKEASVEPLTARAQDPPLPTGLTISREARFDPGAGEITVELSYGAQKAPLSGSFLEVVPGIGAEARCPAVRWDGATGTTHPTSTTGLRAACGWRLDNIKVPANGQAIVTAKFFGTVEDHAELEQWIASAAAATTAALADPEPVSTAYPAQRLQGIDVSIPARTVSETPLAITLLPIWPSGPDALNPLFRSPSTGAPSQMLTDIAGAESPVRFADGCAGAVSVASDGTTATALSVTSDCRLRATVGNFTDLESNPFSITTRE